MSGGIPTWVVPGAATAPVTSVFGRIGSISAQSGDYNTSMITESGSLYYTQSRFDIAFGLKSTTNLTEGTNLYFTNTRAQNALSGTIASIIGSINILSGSINTFSGTIVSISGTVSATNSSISTLS
jgi:hypothetical protein